MKPNTIMLATAISFGLSGCVVGAVADLAATTVVTAGKVAVKGTGALVRAAIPDGDEDKDKKDRENAKKSPPESGRHTSPAAAEYRPAPAPSAQTLPAQAPPTRGGRNITTDEYGNARENTVPRPHDAESTIGQ